MEKVIRENKVAVLYSPGFGSGWYTWNSDSEELVFNPTLVEMVEQGRREEITEELCKELLGKAESDYVCTLGAHDLSIAWIPVGTKFTIQEYDGSESIMTVDDLELTA